MKNQRKPHLAYRGIRSTHNEAIPGGRSGSRSNGLKRGQTEEVDVSELLAI